MRSLFLATLLLIGSPALAGKVIVWPKSKAGALVEIHMEKEKPSLEAAALHLEKAEALLDFYAGFLAKFESGRIGSVQKQMIFREILLPLEKSFELGNDRETLSLSMKWLKIIRERQRTEAQGRSLASMSESLHLVRDEMQIDLKRLRNRESLRRHRVENKLKVMNSLSQSALKLLSLNRPTLPSANDFSISSTRNERFQNHLVTELLKKTSKKMKSVYQMTEEEKTRHQALRLLRKNQQSLKRLQSQYLPKDEPAKLAAVVDFEVHQMIRHQGKKK